MDDDIPTDLLRSYSEGRIARREIAERIGQEVSFGRTCRRGLWCDAKVHRTLRSDVRHV